MNASELRIGNIITNNTGVLFAVCGVFNNRITAKPYGLHLSYPIDPVEFETIPLQITAELLFKCGFVYQMREACFDCSRLRLRLYQNMRCSVYIGFTTAFSWQWHDGNMEVKYLHQLQNLFFALTGEELIVAL